MLRLMRLDKWDPIWARTSDLEDHWIAISGQIDIGRVSKHPGVREHGAWTWVIYKIYEPGWNSIGSADTREEAMKDLASCFRGWLLRAGLIEVEASASREKAEPFTVHPSNAESRWRVTMGEVEIGWVERGLGDSDRTWWRWYVFKVHDVE